MIRRRRSDSQSHMIGELFTFALFAMFLLLALLIVVIGADGYRRVVDTGDSVGAVRTSLGYVAGKVRSESATDGIRLEEKSGVDTLVLTETYQGTPYETIIYFRDGALWEVYMNAEENDFDPEFGRMLTEIGSFDMQWTEESLLELTATGMDGRTQVLHLALRAGQEGTGHE